MRTRLLALIGIVTVPALGLILHTASAQRDVAARAIEADAIRLARLASREHSREITGGRELLVSLSHVSDAVADRDGACPAFFPPLLRGFPHFANLGILTNDGKVSCSVVPLPRPIDMSRTEAFERAMRSGEVEVGDYQIGLIVRRPVFLIAYAVRDPAGAVERVLFVALELRWFGELAAQAELPDGTVLSVLDRQGRILARSLDPERWVGTLAPGDEEVKRATATPSRFFSRADVDGVERLFAVAPLPGVEGVRVSVGVPAASAFAAPDRDLRRQLGALVALALFAALVGQVGTEVFILRGIRALVRATKRLEGGDLEARAPERLPEGEIADLAAAFNAMAEVLEERQREATKSYELLRASEEQLRALSQGLQRAREEECTRIARDLHDQLGQALTALKLDLSAIARAPGGPSSKASDEASGRMKEIAGRVDDMIQFVRDISAALRPGVLDQLGLQAALEWQAQEFEKHSGVACDLHVSRTGVVDATRSTAVFRIFQEALTNVARHAEASRVWIVLAEQDGALTLEVTDDGRGLPEEAVTSPTSLGILGMRERAHLAGGSLTVTSAPGAGTTVFLSMPIAEHSGGSPC